MTESWQANGCRSESHPAQCYAGRRGDSGGRERAKRIDIRTPFAPRDEAIRNQPRERERGQTFERERGPTSASDAGGYILAAACRRITESLQPRLHAGRFCGILGPRRSGG